MLPRADIQPASVETVRFQWFNLPAVTVTLESRSLIVFRLLNWLGRSYGDINDELWITSIAMAVLILILIGLALLYILYEKCQKKREYFISAWDFSKWKRDQHVNRLGDDSIETKSLRTLPQSSIEFYCLQLCFRCKYFHKLAQRVEKNAGWITSSV